MKSIECDSWNNGGFRCQWTNDCLLLIPLHRYLLYTFTLNLPKKLTHKQRQNGTMCAVVLVCNWFLFNSECNIFQLTQFFVFFFFFISILPCSILHIRHRMTFKLLYSHTNTACMDCMLEKLTQNESKQKKKKSFKKMFSNRTQHTAWHLVCYTGWNRFSGFFCIFTFLSLCEL